MVLLLLKINGRYFTFELKDGEGKAIKINDSGAWDVIANIGLQIFQKRGVQAHGELDVNKDGIVVEGRRIGHKDGEKAQRTRKLYRELDEFVKQCSAQSVQAERGENPARDSENIIIPQRDSNVGEANNDRRIQELTNLVHEQMETSQRQMEVFDGN